MDYVSFLVGFAIGIIGTLIVVKLMQSSENKIYNKMQYEFENIAQKIFNSSTDSLSQKNQEKLDFFWKQFKEKFDDLQKQREEISRQESEKLTAFDVNIKNLIQAGNTISHEANSLVRVMRADNRTTGRWGELVLEKVFERSGLRKNEEYVLQTTVTTGKSDATVFLPDNKKIFIDAKTSFASWDAYVNADNEDEKNKHLEEFKKSIKSHIKSLINRDYVDENSFQYIMMFIPIESCYSLIFCDECELWDEAWKNKIMPVSPSTLLASLKIVSSMMILERQNKNAQEIVRISTGMVDKFAGLLSDIKNIRKNLDDAFTKLEGKGNIFSQIQKLEEIGIKGKKEISEINVANFE